MPTQIAWNASWSGESESVAPKGLTTPAIGSGWTIGALRADGFNDGVNTIQGVRSYDANANQWTTPDAYAGSVHDPMTQKSYVWNGDNPVGYSDPTGYDPYVILDPRQAMQFGHVMIAVMDPSTGKGILWSQGPMHAGKAADKQVITRQNISLGQINQMAANGFTVVTEHTSSTQDSAMNSIAQKLYSEQSGADYNVAANNCDEFAGQVLGAGDPASGAELNAIIPKMGVIDLIYHGWKELGTTTTQAAPSNGGNGNVSTGDNSVGSQSPATAEGCYGLSCSSQSGDLQRSMEE